MENKNYAPVPTVAAPTDGQIHAAYRAALGQSIRERDMPEIRKFARALLQSTQQANAVPAVPDGDDFNGSTPHLIQCMEALVQLDADGVLVPHGIGRDASKLLSAAANRLRQQAASSVPKEWRKALQEAHDTFQRYADLHRAKGTQDGYEKSKANQKLANKLYALLQSAPTGEPK